MKMPKALVSALLPAVLFCGIVQAQTKKVATGDTVKTAQVVVTVVNSKKEPRKGEQIIFQSQREKKIFTGTTNNAGTAIVTLPAGDDYSITLKMLTDTSQYGNLTIPPLTGGQFYKEPLRVDITYEPARMYTLDGLQFDVGKATIRTSSFKQLQELLEYMQWQTGDKIEIAGHTDNTGKDIDNLTLSQQRADAVKAWLVKKGISADRVTAKGYGSSQPVADNDTDEGRQKNRRTEVRIL